MLKLNVYTHSVYLSVSQLYCSNLEQFYPYLYFDSYRNLCELALMFSK